LTPSLLRARNGDRVEMVENSRMSELRLDSCRLQGKFTVDIGKGAHTAQSTDAKDLLK
jgi:hypothetical protein